MAIGDLSLEDLRSHRLTQASLMAAERDGDRASTVIARNLRRLRETGRVAPAYIDRCEDLIRQGPQGLRQGFLALTDEAHAQVLSCLDGPVDCKC